MITSQGIHDGISAEIYHADPCDTPSLSSTIGRLILDQSPLHAWHQHPRLNANYKASEDSRFDLGTAAHAMLLERDASRIVWVDADDWRTKAAKEQRDAARAAGKLPILARYDEPLSSMVRVALATIAESELAGIFDTGKPEQTVLWQDNGGIWCRARPDWFSPGDQIMLDYKTTSNASPDAFIKQIANMGYDFQDAFYTRGLAACGMTNAKMVFLVQEIDAPYACSLVSLGNAYCAIAADKVDRAIETWRLCMQSGRWPAYSHRIHFADPPAWALNEFASKQAFDAGVFQ